MTTREITDRIRQLKEEKHAVIYTRPEIQDIADYLGDSLGLSQEAGKTDAEIIVFCGVHFMAETAAIISPEKKVLIPVLGAGCSLAESITGEDLRQWKETHPDGIVVSYVNTTADVKAWTDVCCTSANALKVVESLPKDKQILFVPDKNLGAWIMKKTGRQLELWDGNCCVHQRITAEMILEKHEAYPEADILIHPECACASDERILNLPEAYLYSTAGNGETCRPIGQTAICHCHGNRHIAQIGTGQSRQGIYPPPPGDNLQGNEESDIRESAGILGEGTTFGRNTGRY